MEPLLLPKVHLTGKLRRVPPDTDLPTSTGGFQTRRPKRPAFSPERPLRCGQRHAGIRSRITPAQLLQLGGDLGEYSVTCRESSETSLCGSSDILPPDPMTTAAEVATMTIQQKVLCYSQTGDSSSFRVQGTAIIEDSKEGVICDAPTNKL